MAADQPQPATDRAVVRQRIAQALFIADEGPRRADDWWDAGEYEAHRARYYKYADAVVALLEPAGHGWCPVHGSALCPEDYMLRRDGTPHAGYLRDWSEDFRCGQRQPTYRLALQNDGREAPGGP